ncbi:unnamed protein product [Sympodiomycopsis kandeliae]
MPIGMAHSHTSRPAPLAIVLKSQDKESKRYITELPRSLDGLLLKAQSLFPVPSGHTPYITLDQDDQTVILEDAIPFIRDREVLVFRWSPETPRKCTGNRVKWDSSVTSSATSSGSRSNVTLFTPASSSQSHRPVLMSRQLSSSGTPSSSSSSSPMPSLQPIRSPPNTIAQSHDQHQRTSLKPPQPLHQKSQAQLHRAAHTRRVLEEQRRQREAEEAEEAQQAGEDRTISENAQTEESNNDGAMMDDDTVAPSNHQADENTSASNVNAANDPSLLGSTSETCPDRQHDGSSSQRGEEQEQHNMSVPDTMPTLFLSQLAPSDLEVSGSSPPPYSSPHANVESTTSSSSNDNTAQNHRQVTPENDERSSSSEPASSPLAASPTRDVHAAVIKTSMSPHLGDKLIAGPSSQQSVTDGQQEEDVTAQQEEAATEPHTNPFEEQQEDESFDMSQSQDVSGGDSDEELEQNVLLQSSPSSPQSTLSEVEAAQQNISVSPDQNELQGVMRSVIQNLRNHPSNDAFRDPLPKDFQSFAEMADDDGGGAIDLHIISGRIDRGEYGSGQEGLSQFRLDLQRMWLLLRDFYGPRSPQGRCATVMEKFAEVLLNELKSRRTAKKESLTTTTTTQKRPISQVDSQSSDQQDKRQRAAALMASWGKGNRQPVPTNLGRRATKANGHQTSGGGNGFKWPDMMAFHRAIMGEKATDKVHEEAAHVAIVGEEEAEPEKSSQATSEAVVESNTESNMHGDTEDGTVAESTTVSLPNTTPPAIVILDDDDDDDLSSVPSSPEPSTS